MAESAEKSPFPRSSEPAKRLAGETPPAECHTTPQVPIQEPIDPFPGRIFGDYEILERIARGGMGVVYKARQISLNRLVALKIIPGSELANPVERQRFRVEVEAAASIDHPRIVPIYEVGEREGYYFYSMRLIEGGNLAQHMARYRDDHRAAARLIISAARGIHYAHQRGILHRDLKPANILLDSDGRPHVADFGVAKHLQLTSLGGTAIFSSAKKNTQDDQTDPAADSPRGRPPSGELDLTQVGEIVGTPSYMAPEQASGKKGVVTVAADVYSLGAILYEMLTGRPPFKGPTRMATVRQVLTERPIPPRQLNPKIDRDLERICLKCLERDPQQRYPSAEALADDLERWLAGEPVWAASPTWWYRTWKWMKRRPAMAALVALTALISALALVGITWQARLAHGQAERAWWAELAFRQEREHRLQHQRLEQRWQAVRRTQLAWLRLQEGAVQEARQFLNEVSEELRDWYWHFVDACLRPVEVPAVQDEHLVEIVPHAEGWWAITREGQVWHLSQAPWLKTPWLNAVRKSNLPTLGQGSSREIIGATNSAEGSLLFWSRDQASLWHNREAMPRWTWRGLDQEIAQVCVSSKWKTFAVVYQDVSGCWHVAIYGPPEFPRVLRVPRGTPRGSGFIGGRHFTVIADSGDLFVWCLTEKGWEETPSHAYLLTTIQSAVVAPSGHFALVLSDGTCRLGRWRPDWDRIWLDDPQGCPARVVAVDLSADGEHVALGLDDGSLILKQAHGAPRRIRGSQRWQIRRLCFSLTNHEVAFLTTQGQLWRIPITFVQPSPTGPKCSFVRSYQWPRHLNVKVGVADISRNMVISATADGKLFVARLLDAPSGQLGEYWELATFAQPVTALAWCESQSLLVVALADGSIYMGRYCEFDTSWNGQRCQHPCAVRHLAIAPDGSWFASYDEHGRLWLWDMILRAPALEIAPMSQGIVQLHASDLGLHVQDQSGTWWTWPVPAAQAGAVMPSPTQ
ncbi:MAG: WD40 repeat domain-containing serine/threonine protein kinase [Gemmatales bacterium]|nr:WD40 repeat domain-containing serine/threonine protein kinase [Gemmatales bacterium]MDW7995475.1 WD40 repeat domain-containing serine/threonine protein kinase [Gemmatales bacterium]